MITRWETERKREFTEFLRFYLPDVPEDIDITELAIAVFVCFHGYNPSPGRDGTICIWRFPEVLGHSCLHSGGVKDRALNHNDTYVTIANDVSSALAWSKARSVFWYEDRCWNSHLAPIKDHAGAIIGMMRLIVRALGLDPLRATYQELELCDRRVRCLVCAEEGREEYVYTWEAAVSELACGGYLVQCLNTNTSTRSAEPLDWWTGGPDARVRPCHGRIRSVHSRRLGARQ